MANEGDTVSRCSFRRQENNKNSLARDSSSDQGIKAKESDEQMFEPGRPVPLALRTVALVIGVLFLIICGAVAYNWFVTPHAWLTPGKAIQVVAGLCVGTVFVLLATKREHHIRGGPDLRAWQGRSDWTGVPGPDRFDNREHFG